jgi:hypothetical protein
MESARARGVRQAASYSCPRTFVFMSTKDTEHTEPAGFVLFVNFVDQKFRHPFFTTSSRMRAHSLMR